VDKVVKLAKVKRAISPGARPTQTWYDKDTAVRHKIVLSGKYLTFSFQCQEGTRSRHNSGMGKPKEKTQSFPHPRLQNYLEMNRVLSWKKYPLFCDNCAQKIKI